MKCFRTHSTADAHPYLLYQISVKVVEKTDEELELEELLFGKDIINDKSHREEEEVEVSRKLYFT